MASSSDDKEYAEASASIGSSSGLFLLPRNTRVESIDNALLIHMGWACFNTFSEPLFVQLILTEKKIELI